MLYCARCGQCAHIDNEDFIRYQNTSGWESSYIDCQEGEHVEYKDSETTDSEYTDTECPTCQSNSIEWESEATAEEAFAQRAIWQREQEDIRIRREEFNKQFDENMAAKEADWDVLPNEVLVEG